LSKHNQNTIKQPSVWCHETWRNDFTPPVSFFIGATRECSKLDFLPEQN